MIIKYKTTDHSKYSMKFHLVFTTKYRVKFLNEKIQFQLKDIFESISNELHFEILEMELMFDHVHILFEIKPSNNLTRIIRTLKGRSSKIIRTKYKYLKTIQVYEHIAIS